MLSPLSVLVSLDSPWFWGAGATLVAVLRLLAAVASLGGEQGPRAHRLQSLQLPGSTAQAQ